MAAIQQPQRFSFGAAEVYYRPLGTTQYLPYANAKEFDIDHKIDLKEIFDEKGYPVAVFDGHRTIDLSVKHYGFALKDVANDLGQAAPGASVSAFSFQESGTIPGTPYQVTLSQGAQFVAGSLVLQVVQSSAGGVVYPVLYAIVAGGSEVAGVSASVNNVGVITFAAGDTAKKIIATYQYTNTSGKQMAWANSFQNSQLAYNVLVVKRDTSQVDNSVSQIIVALNAVRFGGLKFAWNEGTETVYERTLKAFSDPVGQIGYMAAVNTTGDNAP